ncbi:hypothetical protein HNP87_001607 [Methanococcus maripaludis]|uniref:Uncharacterized protein n=1 Tax=Methanococcus maripaludis TaxID=39152 RepID=A0A7J9P2J8_METMI|nr:hypothetical protein [Methanococcus maripaludis]MBA2841058.1 hypothetical protein [Methanococcus maripaludis]MBA2853613.1 hypothetical protein [Methanococcus maripaludis]MBA2860746.1 hypothetical protein [Methanococcus maripaludis]MBB6402318.1 hypothetical protein [Methanococcus maripaludis]
MPYSDKEYSKIQKNIKHIIATGRSSDDEFKNLLGLIYASIKLKNQKCTTKMLDTLKNKYNLDLIGDIDKFRIYYYKKSPHIKTEEDLKEYIRNNRK